VAKTGFSIELVFQLGSRNFFAQNGLHGISLACKGGAPRARPHNP